MCLWHCSCDPQDPRLALESLLIILPGPAHHTQCPRMLCKPFALSNVSRPKSLISGGTYLLHCTSYTTRSYCAYLHHCETSRASITPPVRRGFQALYIPGRNDSRPMFFGYKSGPAFLSMEHQSQHRPVTSTYYHHHRTHKPTLSHPLLNVQIYLHRLLRPRALFHPGRTRPASGTRPYAYTLTGHVRHLLRQPHRLSQQRRVLGRGQRPRLQVPDVQQDSQLPLHRRCFRCRVELSELRRVLEHH